MIHTIRTVAVGDQESKIDSPIILYRGDREVEVEFTINGSKFTFTNGGNVIKSTNATHGQLVINTPTGENMFSEVTECHDGKVVFVITKEMIDELIEVGFYSFQIRLFDESQVSRVTIPPVLKGIDIRNPIAAEDETNVVDIALVDYSVIVKDQFEDLSTFLPDGNYNKTEWESKDVISGAKLNKIEDALYNINYNMEATDLAILNRIDVVNRDLNERDLLLERDITALKSNLEIFKSDTDNKITILENDINDINGKIPYVTIKELGAKGDGVTDDTQIFKNALDIAYTHGGVHLYVQKGTYVVNGYCDIYSNTYIEFERGATIIKNRLSETSYLFVCGRIEDRGTVGYGGGAKNVTIKNGNFIGYLDNNIGVSLTFNHIENFTMENCFFKHSVANGHVLDLAGCKDIYVKNCRFEGMREYPGRGYTEAIQIDNSTPDSLSNNFSNYDYIATKNVYVERCSFTPSYDSEGRIIYPCPAPIGSHHFWPGHYYENINFMNNYVENHQRLGSKHTGGCVRFYSVIGLNIIGNHFKNTKGLNGYVISIQTKNVDGIYQPCRNINISNNTIQGQTYDGDGIYSVIRIYGSMEEGDYTYYCEDVTVQNNRIIDCHGGGTDNPSVGPDVISLEKVRGAKILGNYVNSVRRLTHVKDSQYILIDGNSIHNAYYVPLSINICSDVIITNNILNTVAPALYMSDVDRFTVSSNVARDVMGYLAPNYGALYHFRDCWNGVIHGNVTSLRQDETYDSGLYCYSVYNKSKNIMITNNITTGFNNYAVTVYIGVEVNNVVADDISKTKCD